MLERVQDVLKKIAGMIKPTGDDATLREQVRGALSCLAWVTKFTTTTLDDMAIARLQALVESEVSWGVVAAMLKRLWPEAAKSESSQTADMTDSDLTAMLAEHVTAIA